MRSITEQLETARKAAVDETRARIKASGASNRAGREFTEIRRRVMMGETTGCPVRDVALAGPFHETERTDALLDKLEVHLRGFTEQLALIVYDEPTLAHSFTISSKHSGPRFALGILTGSKLVASQLGNIVTCVLSVSQMCFENPQGKVVMQSHDEAFKLDWRATYIFGDDDVMLWMDEHRPNVDLTPVFIAYGKMEAPVGHIDAK